MPLTPPIGSIWYEDDKRYPVERRRVEVLAVDDGRVTILRPNGIRTKIRQNRFGESSGYLDHP